MENQSKSIQIAPQLFYRHLLFQFLTSQFGENTLPSDDVTLISILSDSTSDISDINFLIALQKRKHTCTYHLSSNIVFYSHLTCSHSVFIFSVGSSSVCKSVKSPFYPRIERYHARGQEEMMTLE